MDERRMQFRTGAAVLGALLAGALLVTLNGPAPQDWVPWAKGKYHVTIDLDQAPGIAPNTPVRKNGILIGRVAQVQDLDDRVLVTARIDDDIKLYPEYACQVRTSVLGDATVDFVSRRVPPNAVPLTDGGTVRGTVLENPLDMLGNLQGDIAVTINSLGRAGDEVANLATNINRALGQEEGQARFIELLDRTIAALDNFSNTMQSVEDLFEDQELRNSLKSALADVPAAVRDIRSTMQDASQTLEGVERVLVSADKNLRNLEGLTEPLGENGERIVNAVLGAVEGVDLMLEEITLFSRTLTSSQGTIGRLIREPQLYDDISDAARRTSHFIFRLHTLTNQLSPDLRKTVHDASVFMDKVSREPGRLIGGSLQRGPGIK